MDVIAQRNDVDPASFGVVGYNLGAYVALSERKPTKRIHALILDSIYDQPAQMVKVEVSRPAWAVFPFMARAAGVEL